MKHVTDGQRGGQSVTTRQTDEGTDGYYSVAISAVEKWIWFVLGVVVYSQPNQLCPSADANSRNHDI